MEGKPTKAPGSVSTKSTGSSRPVRQESRGSGAFLATTLPENSGRSQTATVTLPQKRVERLIRSLKADADPSLILALMGTVPSPTPESEDGSLFTVTLSREQLEKVILVLKPDTDPSMVLALSGVEFVQQSTGTTDIPEQDNEQILEADDVRKGEPGEEGEHPQGSIQEEGESTHVVDAQLHDQGMDKGEVNLEEGRVEGHLERQEGTAKESAKLQAEEREQPLLTPEEVMETLVVRNIEYIETDRNVEERIAEIRPTEVAEETTAENQRMREVEASTDGKQGTEQVPTRETIARTRASPVHIYQRRLAREETSGRVSTEEQQKETSTPRKETVVNSPAKSGATSFRRKRRLLVVSESEEEEDVIFTPLDELPGSSPPAQHADVEGGEEKRKERQMKGKALAITRKKKPRQASSTLVIQEGRQRTQEVEEDDEESL